MKYSSLENFETARIYTKLSSSLFACWKFDSLAVRGLSVGLEGEVEGGARFSSGKCRSVSFQFAHCRGSRLFRESSFPLAQDLRASVHVSGAANLRAEPGVVRRSKGGERLCVDWPPPRQLFVITLRVSIHRGRFRSYVTDNRSIFVEFVPAVGGLEQRELK